MTVEVNLSGREFRNFTVFDVLRRQKQWRNPVIFAAILGASAAVCFSVGDRSGAMLLGNVLLTIGLGVPCVYFATFFSSISRQIRLRGLTRPQLVYTVSFAERNEGITAVNEKETITYAWNKVFCAYKCSTAIYLYLTPQRALILPYSCMDDPDPLWKLFLRKIPKGRCFEM